MRCLDNQRLGKQRVETYQIILGLHSVSMTEWNPETLTGTLMPRASGWRHPAMRLWSGHERALLQYQSATCREWTQRGFVDTCLDKSSYVVSMMQPDPLSDTWPAWWGDPEFHMRHRSNLVWKEHQFYGPQFPDELPPDPDDITQYWNYAWPEGRVDLGMRLAAAYDHAVMLLGIPLASESDRG